MFQKISDDIKKAMKEKDTLRLSTLRMMKSKLLYVNARGDLSEAEIIKILTKYAKNLKEAIEEAQKAGRTEVVEQTEAELKIVSEYLPKELSEAEIKEIVEKTIQSINATSMKEMGQVMKEITKNHPGIDGKVVSSLVREMLT